MRESRDELLARIAGLYYEDGWTQEQISSRLGYSRSAISRLLTEARRSGIVEIYIRRPLERVSGLEQALQTGFGLHEARVLRSQGLAYAEMLRRLGTLAARWLEENLHGRSILGISWGTALYEVAHALRPSPVSGVRVVQMIGSATSRDHEVDGPGLARAFARHLDGQYYTLPAPWLVGDSRVRQALLEDRRIREILGLAAQAEVALVGIGVTDPALSSMVRAGYLSVEQGRALQALGAVGDVCGHNFDQQGKLLDIPLAGYPIGISAETLRGLPRVVGIAGGEAKAPAILGALCSQLVNTLITDDQAASQVLELAQGNKQNEQEQEDDRFDHN